MIDAVSCILVNRNVPIEGGTVTAIEAIKFSGIMPGPLGILETSPSAEAPCRIASHASSVLAIQQILILGLSVASN